MKKNTISLILLPVLFISSRLLAQETFTITTYYPSPYGSYNELRAKRVAIGDNYINTSSYAWGNQITNNADLVVEGDVGIGTTKPEAALDIIKPGNAKVYEHGIRVNRPDSKGQYAFMGYGQSSADAYFGSVYTGASNYYGRLIFRQYAQGMIYRDAMMINQSGNVGIGPHPGSVFSAYPDTKLTILGTAKTNLDLSTDKDHYQLANNAGTVFARLGLKYSSANMYISTDLTPNAMIITRNGNVGIGGRINPTQRLEVHGAIMASLNSDETIPWGAIALVPGQFFSGHPTPGLVAHGTNIDIGFTGVCTGGWCTSITLRPNGWISNMGGILTNTGEHLWIQNSAGANRFALRTSDGIGFGRTWSGGWPDLAENINTMDGVILEPGDIVMPDARSRNRVIKAEGNYNFNTLGVISTSPGLLLNQDVEDKEKRGYPVSLAGRVPVKVSTINGPVKIGDPIASSSIPGIGMKATLPGRVIGFALENFPYNEPQGSGKIDAIDEVEYHEEYFVDSFGNRKDGQEGYRAGKIAVFINPTWYTPDAEDSGSYRKLSALIENLQEEVELLKKRLAD